MKKFFLLVVLIPVLLFATIKTISSASSVPAKYGSLKLRGSIPYWEQTLAIKTYQKNPKEFNQIVFFWYRLTADGNIVKYEPAVIDKNLITKAHQNGTKVSILIANLPENEDVSDWDSDRVKNVISDPVKKQKHIQDIINLLTSLNADGISIDYEEVDSDQKQNFTNFIRDLNTALDKKHKYVGLALHPKTGEKSDKQYAFQDWKQLGIYADELYIMAYGEHWDEGSAGPIASVGGDQKIIDYAKSQKVPSQKIYLGLPLYGYDWNHDNDESAKGVNYKEAMQLLKDRKATLQFDKVAQVPHFSYIDSSNNHHDVWFENAQSVQAKVDLAKKASLGGVSFWHLGDEDPGVWKN